MRRPHVKLDCRRSAHPYHLDHHHGEEEFFFPAVTRITGDASLMSHNIEQHEAFMPGLKAFTTYATACLDASQPQVYSSTRYHEIIDSFAPILSEHLADEITTLMALDACDRTAELKEAYVAFDLKMREGDKVCRAQLFAVYGADSNRPSCTPSSWARRMPTLRADPCGPRFQRP